jgi:aspartate racemase
MINNIVNFNIRTKPVIAVIGGAGPDAAIDLQIKLSYAMKKKLDINQDQDHYQVIVDNNTNLPNRDKAILSKCCSLLQTYIDSAKKLETIGGNILVIPCNAAHHYFDDIQNSTSMQVANMIKETVDFVNQYYPKIGKVGLLSTTATTQSQLYHKAFAKYNIQVIVPDPEQRKNVMCAIYGIKAGFINNTKKHYCIFNKSKLYSIYKTISKIESIKLVKSPNYLLLKAIKHLEQQGIELIILGCTEIPLVLDRRKYIGRSVLIDPTEILANVAVDYAIKFENKTKNL